MATHAEIERSELVHDGWRALADASARSRTCACAASRRSAGCSPTPTTRATRRRCCWRSAPASSSRARAARASLGVDELILGHYETAIEPDELIVRVRVPRPRAAAYVKFRSRSSEDRPCVAVAAARLADGEERVAIGAVSDRPAAARRARGAELDQRPARQRRLPAAHGRRPRAAGPGDARWMTASRLASLQPGRRAAGHAARAHPALPLPARARARRARGRTSCREGCVVLLPEDVADTQLYGCLVPDTPILARGVARFAGDPVAAVAAPTPRAAARALTCLEADYEPLPEPRRSTPRWPRERRSSTSVDELRGAAGTWTGLRPGGGNVLHTFRLLHGRGEAGFDEAEVTSRASGSAPAPRTRRSSRTPRWPSGATAA